MSNFKCEKCSTDIVEGNDGRYVTYCPHYPLETKQPDGIEERAIDVARKFHDTYEALAPKFGYTTRTDTKRFDHDSPNGKLMIETVKVVLLSHSMLDLQTMLAFEAGQAETATLTVERDRLKEALRELCEAGDAHYQYQSIGNGAKLNCALDKAKELLATKP